MRNQLPRFAPNAVAFFIASVFLAGCSNAATVPTQGSGLAPNGIPAVSLPAHGVPGDLIYAADIGCNRGCGLQVLVFTSKFDPVGSWSTDNTSQTGGACADKGGNVYVGFGKRSSGLKGGSGQIVEFAHGGTSPMATLNDPTGIPIACSADPTTGDLAVVSAQYHQNQSTTTVLFVYKGGSGDPTTYSDLNLSLASVGYDDRGNIFVDGTNSTGGFGFAEFSRGKHSFKNVTLDQRITRPGSVQWDGRHITVLDTAYNIGVIYRFAIHGTRGHVVGSTPLSAQYGRLTETWIQGNRVVGAQGSVVSLYHYPKGGASIRDIGTSTCCLVGVAVSLGN